MENKDSVQSVKQPTQTLPRAKIPEHSGIRGEEQTEETCPEYKVSAAEGLSGCTLPLHEPPLHQAAPRLRFVKLAPLDISYYTFCNFDVFGLLFDIKKEVMCQNSNFFCRIRAEFSEFNFKLLKMLNPPEKPPLKARQLYL